MLCVFVVIIFYLNALLGIERRTVTAEEREFLKEKALITETQYDSSMVLKRLSFLYTL